MVAKFYRPGRWSDAAIREEHAFAGELAAQEIPVVAPLLQRRANRCTSIRAFATPCFRAAADAGRNWATPMIANGWAGFSAASMRWAEPPAFSERRDCSTWRIWAARRGTSSRGRLDARLPGDQVRRRDGRVVGRGGGARARAGAAPRSGAFSGDCHRGNILWTDQGPHFVDLDDCLTGPAIQDLWMLLAGGRQEMRTELHGSAQRLRAVPAL